MLSIGVVALREGLHDQFYVELKPLDGAGVLEEALAISGLSMDDLSENGTSAQAAMSELAEWVSNTTVNGAVLVSDNPGFDASFIAYYFAQAGIENPFGHSSRRIGDLYAGFKQDSSKASEWKNLRTTTHTHNALDDAVGNAGAILKIAEMGLEIPLL